MNAKVHGNQFGRMELAVEEIRSVGFDQDCVVVVEEVSKYAPFHIARLDAFWREATREYNKAFGGSLVLLTGDLTQLGPVKVRLEVVWRETTIEPNKAFGDCLVTFRGDFIELGPVKVGLPFREGIICVLSRLRSCILLCVPSEG